ncbi:MAG: NRPS condensation-like uncharacterized protein [Pirellulaceae bacterium]|jgi:NRPS condensation-like uncharacterized protein
MSIADLFPLSTTPFEQYMLADERAGYTMTFRVCAVLEGRVDPSRFHLAVRNAVSRQPLLQAIVQPAGNSDFRWTYAGPDNIGIQWHDEPIGFDTPAPIDLTGEAGVRFHLCPSSESTQLIMLAHHGCLDAIGAAEFLASILTSYRQMEPEPEISLVAEELVSLLKQRGRLLPKPKTEESQTHITELAREALRVIATPPLPLVANEQPPESVTPFGDILTATFNEQELQKFRRVARNENVTVNDWLMRDLFCTLQQWNQERHVHKENRLRITMPVNMRPAHETSLCANVLSYCFVTRTAEECREPSRLLESIHQETTIIKRDQLGTHLLYALDLVRKITGGMQLVLRNSCISTTVLSNLGDLSNVCPELEAEADELAVKNFTFIPPVRPGTRAVFAVSTFHGKLSISITTDPHYFNAAGAQDLLNCYLATIRESFVQASRTV